MVEALVIKPIQLPTGLGLGLGLRLEKISLGHCRIHEYFSLASFLLSDADFTLILWTEVPVTKIQVLQ